MTPTDREEVFDVTVPAETSASLPYAQSISWAQGELILLEVVTPDGPSGLVGWRLTSSGMQMIPRNTGAWIIGNDETFTRETEGYPNSGRYEFTAYNEDIYPHTYQVRFAIQEIAKRLPEGAASEPLPISVEEEGQVSQGPPEPTKQPASEEGELGEEVPSEGEGIELPQETEPPQAGEAPPPQEGAEGAPEGPQRFEGGPPTFGEPFSWPPPLREGEGAEPEPTPEPEGPLGPAPEGEGA